MKVWQPFGSQIRKSRSKMGGFHYAENERGCCKSRWIIYWSSSSIFIPQKQKTGSEESAIYSIINYGLNQIGIKIDMYWQEHRFSPATPIFRRFDVWYAAYIPVPFPAFPRPLGWPQSRHRNSIHALSKTVVTVMMSLSIFAKISPFILRMSCLQM